MEGYGHGQSQRPSLHPALETPPPLSLLVVPCVPSSRLPLPFPTARSGPGELVELSTLLPMMLLLFKAVVVR